MDVVNAAMVQGQTALAAGVIKDATAAQVISGTLNRLHTGVGASGPQLDANYQFQKDVLGAAGIGKQLDMLV